MKRPLTVALVAAFIPLLVVLVFYFAKFWSPHLANEQADWGVFGDYVGGTLGALYALAAFLAVLYASYVQSNEAAIALNEQRAQATIEQLQRVVASTAENIDRILRAAPMQPLSGPHQRAQLQGAAFNVDWVLTAAAARRLTGDETNPAEAV